MRATSAVDDSGHHADGKLAENAADFAAVLENVSFEYSNGTRALQDVTVKIPRGHIVGLVGPSGCGKTTLLALLGGLAQPTSGTVEMRPHGTGRHPVSMMFQKDTLLPWLTVADNVKLYYRLHRRRQTKTAVAAMVRELVALAGLQGFEKAYPYELSGGMRRRVAFLASVAPRPEVLLLDEPFSSLDEPTRVAIHQDVFSIVRQYQMSVVLATHDLAEAVTLCDEVIILTSRPGRVHLRQPISFGDERDMLELRQSPEFLELYGRLWHELSEQIGASRRSRRKDEGEPD